jgi:hypothetical protein
MLAIRTVYAPRKLQGSRYRVQDSVFMIQDSSYEAKYIEKVSSVLRIHRPNSFIVPDWGMWSTLAEAHQPM